MHVAVLDFFLSRLAHLNDLHLKMQILTSHRVIQIDIDHSQPNLLHSDGLCSGIGLQHHLHPWGDAGIPKLFLRYPLCQPFAVLPVGISGLDVNAEALPSVIASSKPGMMLP